MQNERTIQQWAAAARHDQPPSVDVADGVIATLVDRSRRESRRVMATFAVAACVLAALTLGVAVQARWQQRDARMARQDLFGQMPSLMAKVAP